MNPNDQDPNKNRQLDDYAYDEEDYEDLLMEMPYDFMELSDTDIFAQPSDNQNPYAEDMAYLDDIEALTGTDDDEDPPLRFRDR